MNHENIGGAFTLRADKITLDEKAAARLCALAPGCEDETADMIAEAEKIAVPKAIYSVASAKTSAGGAEVGGVFIRSALMEKNFSSLSRVFPFVITAGEELGEWANSFGGDPLSEYLADEINKAFLYVFVSQVRSFIRDTYGVRGRLPSMNPGSLEKDWSIKGQDELFGILGGRENVKAHTGVSLKESFLMVPSKSASGIYFETETDYENCKYCPRTNCPNRRAPSEVAK